LRRRLARRAGLEPPPNLVAASMVVDGRERRWWTAIPLEGAPPTPGPRPLLLALHGGGGTAPGMAALTGLADRGPAAGYHVVFPEGVDRGWNDERGASGVAARERVDDGRFLGALVERLASTGEVDPARVAMCGISNGAFMSEHVARYGLVRVQSIGLVAGTASEQSRGQQPRPSGPVQVVMIEGTDDGVVPYGGGPIDPLGQLRRNPERPRRWVTGEPGRRRGVAEPAEVVAGDWVEANGLPAAPAIDAVGAPGDLAVDRVGWRAAGRPSVTLYRVHGGGHTWPGGPQYLPPRVVGHVARSFDATAVLLRAFADPTS
jgi:polyhydroxybutyrate depolymerase